jgi:hypothetical protein
MAAARDIVKALEGRAEPPAGVVERFSGYGVLGLTFASGDILCFRRWPGSSLGPSYTSLWHRRPDGSWCFVQDVPPRQACTRYFGSAVDETVRERVRVEWSGPNDFRVSTGPSYEVQWDVGLKSSPVTVLLTGFLKASPDALWRWRPWLDLVGLAGSAVGGAGRMKLTGYLPNGQWFVSRPRALWAVSHSRATVKGTNLGEPGPLPEQARLADIWIPQKGRFFVGDAFLEPFDAGRHLEAVSRAE